MKEPRKFICKNCNKEFSVNYPLSSTRILTYCSKFCKSKKEGFQEKFLKEDLTKLLINTIKRVGYYCTMTDLIKYLKVSSKTINKHKISIIDINNQAGFSKPKSKFENDIYKILLVLFDNHIIEREKCFSNLKSPKGYSLFFDFYIPSKNLIIEADGMQHYDLTNPMYSDYLICCDNLKNKFCRENDITIVRIPYKRNITDIIVLELLKDYSTKLS